MFFMADEKPQEKTVVVSKKLILMVGAAAIVAVILLITGWLLNSEPAGNTEYMTDSSPVLGNASVYVIEFSDYECPYCQAAEGTNQAVIDTLKQTYHSWEAPIPKIVEEYVNTGKVSLVFRQYPMHANKAAAMAAKCAQEQGKFWEYHNYLFENYNTLGTTDLKKYALTLDLDISSFSSCLDSGKYQTELDNDISDGRGLGVTGTPTFFIGNEELGFEKIVGAQSFSDFKAIIDSKISV
jgi:protein-disulfide isomerase